MRTLALALVSFSFLASNTASATEPIAPSDALHDEPRSPVQERLLVDVELDPIAYALDGHSVHVGLTLGHWRFDLGAFGLELPTWAHGNDGFTASFSGFGVKAQLYLDAPASGPFVGVGLGLARTLVERDGTDLADRSRALSAGLELGWLIPIVEGLYLKPWVGIGWAFGTEDVVLGDERFEANPLQIFPTVHLGYRF